MKTNFYTYLPFIVNIPKLWSDPIKFSAAQIYNPALDDCKFIIVNELAIVRPFIELEILYLLISDIFIMAPLKYQLILGTG